MHKVYVVVQYYDEGGVAVKCQHSQVHRRVLKGA